VYVHDHKVPFNLSQTAIVRVTFAPKFSESVEVRVELNGINIADGHGKDITVNFELEQLKDGNSTFYTDSNSLEMQERRLNYRPSFTFNAVNNISANYYPIASAVSIKEYAQDAPKVQMTVLNEKTQAGSAHLVPGRIEMIQNRRLITDDNKGVIEVLNETDSEGYGIKVDSSYWV
jgi:hypothetical protein